MRCAECGGELVYTSSPFVEQMNGEDFTVYGVGRFECGECGEYEIEASEERKLSEQLFRMYRQRHGLLLPEDIAALRKSMGLSQAEFGKLVEANVQTVSRWENGRVAPDARANKLMLLLRDNPPARASLCEMAEIHPDATMVSCSGMAAPRKPYATWNGGRKSTVSHSGAARPTNGAAAVDLYFERTA